MRARKRGRYLAPIALVAVVVVTLLVVRGGLKSTHDSTSSQAVVPPSIATHRVARRRFYVVRPGDSLSVISAKTGISVSSLTALNPSVAPNALQVGQRLRLVR